MFKRRTGTVIGTGAASVVLAVVVWAAAPLSQGEHQGVPSPPPPPSPASTYVGSAPCQACHAQVAQGWEDAPHGKGLGDPQLPQELRGCESCHGPGSEHVGSTGKKKIGETFVDAGAERAEAVCGKCHVQAGESAAPAAWRSLDSKYWRRTLHARQQVSCLNCHKIHGGKERALQEPVSALCLKCHQGVLNKQGEYTHSPVAKGQCLLCHLPHGGAARHNLTDRVSTACLSCHRPGEPAFAAAHSKYPVDKGDCLSCHNPHSFDREKALLGKFQHQPFAARKCDLCHRASAASPPELIKPQKELCLTCHPAEKVMPTTGPGGSPLTQHPPVKQGLCTTCHGPHATDYPKQLKDRTDYLCFFCHGKTEGAALSSIQHKPVATGNCLLCHQGHASADERLLNKESIALCTSCHATQGRFTHPVGVRAGKPVRDPNTGKAVTCARCHAVHGSRFAYLLPQEEDALCRGCHKK